MSQISLLAYPPDFLDDSFIQILFLSFFGIKNLSEGKIYKVILPKKRAMIFQNIRKILNFNKHFLKLILQSK
jgi:hypothetical protein